ncbi:MAG: hypothetical protein JKX97_08355 [Candidatus Lindowbacteria bacterium]|nr:hypothetical protein [Candidatus Lindowbacteria bacterium]
MRKIYSPKRDMIELSNMVRCADLIVRSALKRNESRGLHALEGVPFVKSDEYINQHTVLENETPQVLF